jgi:hypothetical protein
LIDECLYKIAHSGILDPPGSTDKPRSFTRPLILSSRRSPTLIRPSAWSGQPRTVANHRKTSARREVLAAQKSPSNFTFRKFHFYIAVSCFSLARQLPIPSLWPSERFDLERVEFDLAHRNFGSVLASGRKSGGPTGVATPSTEASHGVAPNHRRGRAAVRRRRILGSPPRPLVNGSIPVLSRERRRTSHQGVLIPSAAIRIGVSMKTLCLCAALALSITAIASPADARGCLKGAIVGGAAGHYAGHHGFAGAALGCAIGHHEAQKHDDERYRNEPSRKY